MGGLLYRDKASQNKYFFFHLAFFYHVVHWAKQSYVLFLNQYKCTSASNVLAHVSANTTTLSQ